MSQLALRDIDFDKLGSTHSSYIEGPEMDLLDIRILDALQKDGAVTKAELADQVGSTPSTCAIIRGQTAV